MLLSSDPNIPMTGGSDQQYNLNSSTTADKGVQRGNKSQIQMSELFNRFVFTENNCDLAQP